ncbi:MAG: arsenate reductase ArsC [Betaproteobacteria bacterium]|jgi:arsenate reductase|nr:arsenate reductase ArsC [Betaproteobacteria bacterium]
MSDTIYNVLFVCTGNTARSIMAEGLLNHMGRGRFKAYSAGSMPKGVVHPAALKVLNDLRAPTGEVRSKSWSELAQSGAPKLDFVFTVCDNAAGEVCPVWPGQPMSAHWGVEDPAAFEGTPEQVDHKFHEVAQILKRRIELFLSLPMRSLDKLSLQNELRDIGKK